MSPKIHSGGGGGGGESAINPAKLTNQSPKLGPSAASSGTHTGELRQTTMMPPPSQPTLTGGATSAGMTSIREERETSQP